MPINGLLIDTLVFRFFNQTNEYRKNTILHDRMVLDFFNFLSQLPKQEYWNAMGSRQRVYVKKNFQGKAKKAAELCEDAIASEGKTSMYAKWRKVFGRFASSDSESKEVEFDERYRDTEEFIEDFYSIKIQYQMTVNCNVTQDGFRSMDLKEILRSKIWLRPSKKLHFYVSFISVPEPYDIRWKVLNRGSEAESRNEIRGQIIKGNGKRRNERVERTKFRGDHYVECYAIKDQVVVARDRVEVPIYS